MRFTLNGPDTLTAVLERAGRRAGAERSAPGAVVRVEMRRID